ncbi:hypothetical protein NOK70_24205 [Vibrio parahaemolyticus]|nr:hypothetical protein [Vibrio parahaemolyticus]MCX8941439.1 hypothetical protein [Vibrio parahaemolyticus]
MAFLLCFGFGVEVPCFQLGHCVLHTLTGR